MSAFHPTRRDLVLVLAMTLLMSLFLQFDFSLRFTDSSASDSLFGVKVGFGGRRSDDLQNGDRLGNGGDRMLGDVRSGARSAHAAMSAAKVKWGEEDSVTTDVLAHAPGESLWLTWKWGGGWS